MRKLLVVVDMQNDFISGLLGTAEAQAIIPEVAQHIDLCRMAGCKIAFLYDVSDGTNASNLFPLHGYCLHKDIERTVRKGDIKFIKKTQHSCELSVYAQKEGFNEIEIAGVNTDQCVLANVLNLKASMPNAKIIVESAHCAGSTPELHQEALQYMKRLGIQVRETKL